MKKIFKIFIVFTLTSFLFTLKAYAQNQNKIVDNANLFTQKQIEYYSSQVNKLIEKYSCDVVVVTSNNIGNKSEKEYADDFFDYNDYGVGKRKDGILLLISMDKRKVCLSTSGKTIQQFSDKKISSIIDSLILNLKQNDFNGAVQTYIDSVDENLSRIKGQRVMIYFGMVVGSGAISFVIMMFIKRKMHTARKNNYAKRYIKDDSLVLSKEKDIFLYSRVSRSRRSERSSNNSSSSHKSSSGSLHGGGSGSF